MNVMFFSSINTAEFQPFLAAFIIPVFTLPWVKRCEYILSLVNFGEASGHLERGDTLLDGTPGRNRILPRLRALSATNRQAVMLVGFR
jgi:hypothetical protein